MKPAERVAVFAAAAGSCEHEPGQGVRVEGAYEGLAGRDVQWWTHDPAALDFLTPLGEKDEPHELEHTIDAEHGWTWGNLPGADPKQWAEFKNKVIACKSSMAYSVQDIKEYKGPMGPAVIKIKPESNRERPYVPDKPRRYSSLELGVIRT